MFPHVVVVESFDATVSSFSADPAMPRSGSGSPVQQSAFHLQYGHNQRENTGSNGLSHCSHSITSPSVGLSPSQGTRPDLRHMPAPESFFSPEVDRVLGQ